MNAFCRAISASVWALLFLVAFGQPHTFGQSLLLPGPGSFVSGEGECRTLVVGIASPHWRVRKGSVFEVSAVQRFEHTGQLRYFWNVTNGKVVARNATSKIRIKAGGAKTPGFDNVSGFVDIRLTIEQIDAGRRCTVSTSHRVMVGRHQEYNGFADVDDVLLDETNLVHPCVPGQRPREGQRVSPDSVISVSTLAKDPENDVLTFVYQASGGKIVGAGSDVSWDLTGVDAGTYTLTVSVDDGYGAFGKAVTKNVTVAYCDGCLFIECPTITIAGPPVLEADSIFTVDVSGGSQESVTYVWSVVGGEIVEGQGTPSIRMKIHTMPGGSVTVKIGGLDPRGACLDSVTKDFQ